MIRVGIDGRLILKKKIGTGVYTATLCQTIEALAPSDVELILFDDEYSRRWGYRSFLQFGGRGMRKASYLLWFNSYFPWFLKQNRIDVVHAPNIIPPFVKVCKTVITIHDLGLFLHPQFYNRWYQRSMTRLIPRGCAVADAIIVPSVYVRNELIQVLAVPAQKVTVIPEAHRPYFLPIVNRVMLRGVKKKYGLPDHFLLTVGLLTGRKNLKTLVEAFARVVQQLSDRELYLVFVGRDDGEQAHLIALTEHLDIRDRVLFFGYVDDAELPFFYNLAEVFVFPSFYEGFGIPPLEAMACGTPVVASNRSSVPEIVGDGGMLVDPESAQQLTEAMVTVLTQPALQAELRRKGLNRAAQFSPRRFAQATLDVYRSLR